MKWQQKQNHVIHEPDDVEMALSDEINIQVHIK